MSAATAEAVDHLIDVGRRPPITRYIGQLWARRQFIWTWATSQLRASNAGNRLGNLWLVLMPLLMAMPYYLIFGLLLNTGEGIDNFLGYLLVGFFLFQFTGGSLTQGARAISGNRRLVQAIAFPRAALPVAVVLRLTLTTIPALLVMVAMISVAPPAEDITWRWVMVLPAIALQATFNLGLALLLARVVARVNDVANVLPFVTRIWLYTSGVFFSLDRFVTHPTLLSVMQANPMHIYLTLVREPLLYGQTPSLGMWAAAAGWALGVLTLGFVVFWAAEEEYGHD